MSNSRDPELSVEFVEFAAWLNKKKTWKEMGLNEKHVTNWKRSIKANPDQAPKAHFETLVKMCEALRYYGGQWPLPDDTKRRLEDHFVKKNPLPIQSDDVPNWLAEFRKSKLDLPQSGEPPRANAPALPITTPPETFKPSSDDAKINLHNLDSPKRSTWTTWTVLGVAIATCSLIVLFLLWSSRQEVVNPTTSEALRKTGALSSDLKKRGYLAHAFVSGGYCNCEDFGKPSDGSTWLSISCVIASNRGDEYAGLNLFGNNDITPFDPIDLTEFKAITFEFKYPPNTRGFYVLKLKTVDNVETNGIRILGGDGNRGEWQTFELNPAEHVETRKLIGAGRNRILNVGISTNGFENWGGDPKIELRKLALIPKN